ncbi:MAG: hypothetical protein KDG55_18810 [Rhodocyclaceae bacterium]|nr:hypothetical protein [Rhodocyclaceae bacterium]
MPSATSAQPIADSDATESSLRVLTRPTSVAIAMRTRVTPPPVFDAMDATIPELRADVRGTVARSPFRRRSMKQKKAPEIRRLSH